MLKKIYRTLTKKISDATTKRKRSSAWPRVEKHFLQKNGKCVACGTKKSLNVHHKLPFHLHPEKELDETNLITLCMSRKTMCHFSVGHGGSWRAYNPNVEQNAKELRDNPSLFRQIEMEAKLSRLKE
jgi:hypothetical protein